MPEIHDAHVYRSVACPPDAISLFINGLRYYADRLTADVKAITVDPELAKLLDERSLRSFQVSREIEEVREFADRFEEKLPEAEQWGSIDLPFSHGLVKRLKSICLMYLADLEARRDEITGSRGFTGRGLEALDMKLTQWREKLSMGVFRDAIAVPLLAPATAPPTLSPSVDTADLSRGAHPHSANTAPPRAVTSIEIVDQQLRERCLDLFSDFDESRQIHRFDTVVTEATRVLEDRIRRLAGLEKDLMGVELMTKAFGTKPPVLKLSANPSEQEAAHLLFRGAFGFIRNPVHHRLLEQLEKERVVQILGFVDYLLYLAENATK